MWKEFRFVRGSQAALVWKIEKGIVTLDDGDPVDCAGIVCFAPNEDGDSYRTSHGQLGGAMQDNYDTPGSKGLVDSAAFVTPEDNCTFHVSREIRKKTENGYIEYKGGKPLTEQVDGIDFSKPLPKCFCSYKPQTSITDKALKKIAEKKLARYTRKYDGMCHVLVHHTYGWQVYTRRMDLTTVKLPGLIEQLDQLKQFGPKTIIVGELVCLKADGTEDFKAIASFCQSLPEEARRRVKLGEIHEPIFVMFDTLFHNGRDLKDKTYDDRSKLLKTLPPLQDVIDYELAEKDKPFFTNKFRICGVDYFDLTPDTWEDFAKEKGWEGFVLTDGSAKPGDKFYSFNGKAKRPRGHYKLKPLYEEDVVIYAGFKGTGKRLGGIGSVYVKQMHPDTGKWFNCGKVGTGFTDADLVEVKKLLEDNELPIVDKEKEALEVLDSDNGIVMMLEYSERQPGTNKFRFPVFNRVRFDKGVDECEAQRMAPDE